jgi:uncharacterized CHY-type Zn-finger protein
MKIGAAYKLPNKKRTKFFDGMENQDVEFSFLCGACQKRITLDLWSFLDDSSDWEDTFSSKGVSEIIETLDLPKTNQFYKSHEGGYPYISIQSCPNCKHSHLVYIGFYEFQPTRYFGTLQGVYEAIT